MVSCSSAFSSLASIPERTRLTSSSCDGVPAFWAEPIVENSNKAMLRVVFTVLSSLAADDSLRFDRFVPRAAFGVEESDQLFEPASIGRIPQIGSLAAHAHEFFVFKFFQMVGQRRRANLKLCPDVTHDHAIRMGG